MPVSNHEYKMMAGLWSYISSNIFVNVLTIDFFACTVSSKFKQIQRRNSDEIGLTAISATKGLIVLTIVLRSFDDAIAKSPHATFRPLLLLSNAGNTSANKLTSSSLSSLSAIVR